MPEQPPEPTRVFSRLLETPLAIFEVGVSRTVVAGDTGYSLELSRQAVHGGGIGVHLSTMLWPGGERQFLIDLANTLLEAATHLPPVREKTDE